MPIRELAATVAANRSRLDQLEDALAAETAARLRADAVMLHLRDTAVECLHAVAASKDVVDVNVAAGLMLEGLQQDAPAPELVTKDGFVTKRVFALWVAAAGLCGTLFPATYLWAWILG
jgi:hypothetical protein